MNPIAILVFLIAITLNATANILIKASALKKDDASLAGVVQGYLFNPWLIAGVVSFGLALLAYRFVLSQGIKLSVAYPIMTTVGFAIVLVASRFLFNETINYIQWLGIGLLVTGLWLISSQVTVPS